MRNSRHWQLDMPNKPAPQHGGLIRVAFDGGQNIHNVLPFSAVAVNVDNWSPYWYKLNPVEEYIPPFQHGVNISLPLINNYEFVCQAPPGIDQPVIVPTTGIPGNTNPVIAVFSSFGTNNDAGFSALAASSNRGNAFTGFIGLTTIDFDVTLYDGIYLLIRPTTQLIVTIGYVDSTGFSQVYVRVLYANSNFILTIPKITRTIRVIFNQDANRPQTISGSYNIRPFLGALPFSVDQLPHFGNTLPKDSQTITGEATTNYTVTGVDNATLTVVPNAGAGVTTGSFYWIKVTASNYGFQTNEQLLYSKVFMNGDVGFGPNELQLPIGGILSRNIDRLTVFVRPSDGAVNLPNAVTIIALHQNTPDALNASPYDTPIPYTIQSAVAPAPGVWTVVQTLPFGGILRQFNLTILTAGAAGTNVQIAVGTPAARFVFLGFFPANVVGQQYILNSFSPILLDNGLNTIWVISNAAAGVFGYQFSIGE